MGQEVSAAAPAAAVMPMTPATIQRCVQLRLQLDAAPHGAGQALKAAACAELGIGLATLHRYLAEVAPQGQRRQRSDAGEVALSRKEAQLISGLPPRFDRTVERRWPHAV